MTTAGDIINAGVTCVGEHETLSAEAQYMRGRSVGALPIFGDDGRLHRMVTDRDALIKGRAAGFGPNTATAGELARDDVYCVDANAGIPEMLNIMEEHQVRGLSVIENHRAVGMITETDIARHLLEQAIVQFIEAICAAVVITG